MGYTNTGPFTDNTVPPGISANFLNNIENFLDTVNSLATDSHNTSDGSGNVTIGGTITLPNNTAFRSKDSGGTVRNLLIEDGSNQVKIRAGGANNILMQDNSGAILTQTDGNGFQLNVGAFVLNVAAASTQNGSAGGTAAIFFPIWGSALKVMLINFQGYNSTSTPTINFPSAASVGFWVAGNFGASFTLTFYNSGVAQSASLITALGSGSTAGSSVGTSTMHGNNMGQLITTANQIGLGSTAGVAVTTAFLFIGL